MEFVADGGPGHIHDVLYEACPELATTGYELLCSSHSSSGARVLEAIDTPRKGYTVDFLRSWLNQAKCYVRPIQNDLADKGTSSPESVSLISIMIIINTELQSLQSEVNNIIIIIILLHYYASNGRLMLITDWQCMHCMFLFTYYCYTRTFSDYFR